MQVDETADIALLENSRREVINFDKASQATRLVYVPAVLSLAFLVGFVLTMPNVDQASFLFFGGTLVIVASLLFWMLDARYSSYANIAAAVARTIERRLGAAKHHIGVSTELSNFIVWLEESWHDKDMTNFDATEVILSRLMHNPFEMIYLVMSLAAASFVAIISSSGGYIGTWYYALWLFILFAAPILVAMFVWSRRRSMTDYIEWLDTQETGSPRP
ncbi:MAG TPA: hypothetical protein VMS79_02445 [Methanomassiliicoccales archaeon]|nr:hypothetical protein [Methanomassiliicoccales archaeon]